MLAGRSRLAFHVGVAVSWVQRGFAIHGVSMMSFSVGIGCCLGYGI